MTVLLQKAIAQVEKLPQDEQDAMAKMLIEDIKWEETLNNSQEQLYTLAQEAIEEYRKGNTKPLGW